VRVGANVPTIGAGVVGGPFITPFWQSACAKHCSPGGLCFGHSYDDNDE
jgi:hypothetical protein